jgi:hypothetical protein
MSSRSRRTQGLYLILVGAAFAVEGVIQLGHPAYWDAVTDFDYAAVWTHSLVLLLVAPALIILVRQAQAGRAATVIAFIMAAGAVLSGFANAVEDGFHLKSFGTLYVIGAASYAYGMILLAILLGLGARKAFALVPALVAVGLIGTDIGGAILVGATWAIFGILVLTGRTEPDPSESDPAAPGPPTGALSPT